MILPKTIYVMGMPGAGKGTQAEMLAHDIGYHQFSTGNAFRQIALEDSELGREVKKIIDSGLLTPPAMAAKVVMAAVDEYITKGEFLVFDGTPRTLTEMQIITEHFATKGYGDPLILYLEADKETMIERNSKRRLCLDVEREFPVTTQHDTQKCIELGGRVGMRPDDEKEKFTTRYDQFMELTYPVVAKYRSEHNGLFFIVDGMVEPHRVHASIMDIIRQFELPARV